jgi:hypothetical protein
MSYRVVFDVAEAGFKSWTFPAFGLIFVAVGVFMVIARKSLPGSWANRPKASAAFAFFFLGFALLWTLVSFMATYRDYSSLAAEESSGQVQVAEGRVSNFNPMPFSGHSMERFCVEAHCFEYSDYVITGGFNNTSSHGGPIRDGLPVRVTFVGNSIIKLEVAR